MNKLNSVISEIGVIETALNVVKYADDAQVVSDCSKYMPFPDVDFKQRIISIAKHINKLHKKKIMLITPEIALVEQLLNFNTDLEIIICIPSGLDDETLERIIKNINYGPKVTIIEENTFPKGFNISNAAIVSVGYVSEDKAIILKENYKTMNIYEDFYGMKILISCQAGVSNERPNGWIAINPSEFFTHICTERGIEDVLERK